MRPARGLLLVRPIEPEETYVGGKIIVPEVARQRLTTNQCECVAIGDSEICLDEDCERLHTWTPQRDPKTFGKWSQRRGTRWLLWSAGKNAEYYDTNRDAIYAHPKPCKPGDWLLVTPRSYLETGEPERKLWLVRQRDVLAILRA